MATEQIELTPGTGRLLAWLARHIEHVLAGLDLTLAQYRLLTLLEQSPEVASALADKLTVKRPSITAVVDGLVARGLVERGSAEGDRRRVTHELTDKGRQTLQEADEAVERSLAVIFTELDPRGARHAIKGLGGLAVAQRERLAQWGKQK
jgi:long-chain acyl-CoA synthetase